MLRKSDLRALGQSEDLLPVLSGKARDEMALKQGKVFSSISQPWHLNLHHREAVVKVLPKTPLGDGGAQIVICRGNDARIDLMRSRSHTLHLLVLQDPQELRLGAEWHISNLVQEQRASMRMLKQTGLVLRGSSVSPVISNAR